MLKNLFIIIAVLCSISSSLKCSNRQLLPVGDTYIGSYKDGMFNGQGTYTYANGDKYVGEFKNGSKHGQGTYTYANGDKYVGEFHYDIIDGQGTYTYTNGDKYIGAFLKKKKNGQGTYIYANGNKYTGEFEDDKMHGKGTLTQVENSILTGEWLDNVFINGEGTLINSDGSKFVGNWENGRIFTGKGTFIDSKGSKIYGEWLNGLILNAKGLLCFSDGSLRDVEYKNGYRINVPFLRKLPKNINKGKFGGGFRNYKWGMDYYVVHNELSKDSNNKIELGNNRIAVVNNKDSDELYFIFYDDILYQVVFSTKDYIGWGNPGKELIDHLSAKYGVPDTREDAKFFEDHGKTWFAEITYYTWSDNVTMITIQSQVYQTGAMVVSNLVYSSIAINDYVENERIEQEVKESKF